MATKDVSICDGPAEASNSLICARNAASACSRAVTRSLSSIAFRAAASSLSAVNLATVSCRSLSSAAASTCVGERYGTGGIHPMAACAASTLWSHSQRNASSATGTGRSTPPAGPRTHPCDSRPPRPAKKALLLSSSSAEKASVCRYRAKTYRCRPEPWGGAAPR